MRIIACVLALCAALMGCGQKGPLFLPEQGEAETRPAAPQAANGETQRSVQQP